MKKVQLLLASVLLLTFSGRAQQLVEDNFNQLKVHYSLPEVKPLSQEANGTSYAVFDIDGFWQSGEVGTLSLPMQNTLLVVPFCQEVQVKVENAVYDTFQIDQPVMPMQPSRSKSDRSKPVFVINNEVYATDAVCSLPLAEVEVLGVARDRRYAHLHFAPVSVNPVSGQVVVCRSADVTVTYIEPDVERTLEVYNRYYTPAFSLGTTFNNLFVSPKSGNDTPPLRMVIMAAKKMECKALNEFADWKRKQGFLVDINYVDNGTAANTVASQLQAMYDDASATTPAPTYVILVGDVAYLKAHNSRLSGSSWSNPPNDHVTDLYYVTWTSGDNLPDAYQGRFSATDTGMVRSIVDKTIYYERYDFENDDYLTNAVLISGVDAGNASDNAYKYSDPTMDYAAYFYVNSDNGFDSVTYFKNNINHHPGNIIVTGNSNDYATAGILRQRYNEGVGFANYSAHGDWDCWADPEFNTNHVNSMSNNGMPSFMIGNCCLSNKFDKTTCFGESLLRKGNRAGAVGYIGGTNVTYWTDDFVWSVGVRNNISNTMNPQYFANNTGMYDHLFHTHNEALNQHMVTAGKMIVQGNMGIQNSSSSFKQYYWEIYELMGDPSLMPWLGKARTLTAHAGVFDGLVVNTEPGAYVALVRNNDMQALSGAFAGADGKAILSIPGGTSMNSCFIAVNAQGFKPFTMSASQAGIDQVSNAEVSVVPNPATGRCEVTAEGLRQVSLVNLVGQTLRTIQATNGRCTVTLDGIPSGVYLLRLNAANGTSVKKLIVK